jgi:hypothetical protein
MENLIKIDGEPLTKLIEVVANGIGKWYEPRYVVRMASAEAKAEHIKVIEKAKRNALLENNEDLYEQLSVVENRLLTKETRRQQNIEQVVSHAANIMSLETEVSSESVDPDWITRFFDIAQDISNEQMQELWGRVLAGEVKQPKSFSLRTLETLRNITSEEAQLFENIAPYMLCSGSSFIYNNISDKKGSLPISYEDVAQLIEIGLVQSGNMVTMNYYNDSTNEVVRNMSCGDYLFFLTQPPQMHTLSIPVYPLTLIGNELYNLLTIVPDIDYLKTIMKELKNKNIGLKIAYTKILHVNENGDVKYDADNMIEIE